MKQSPEAIAKWYHDAYADVIGKTIVDVRPLTDDEFDIVFGGDGWGAHAFVLDDGTCIIPASDEEGNGPGSSFVYPFEIAGEDDE